MMTVIRKARPNAKAAAKEASHERIVAVAARAICKPGAHEQALVTVATMVGAAVLARAVDEPGLSDSICQAALTHLVPKQG